MSKKEIKRYMFAISIVSYNGIHIHNQLHNGIASLEAMFGFFENYTKIYNKEFSEDICLINCNIAEYLAPEIQYEFNKKYEGENINYAIETLVEDIKKIIISEDKDVEQNDCIILTRELINTGKTDKGGFTSAQVEYLGFDFGEKWIDRCIGKKITQKEYLKFLNYRFVDAKQLKSLKKNNEFKVIGHDNT
ncbi:hypothetical protein [Sulfurimonas sp.]